MPRVAAVALLFVVHRCYGLQTTLSAPASRSVLVAGIYPDRPWEKPAGTDIQELERLRMEVLRVREELQQSRSELEKQQTPPGPSQGRILGKRPPERGLSNLLSLGLWVSLGAVAGHRMHTGRSVPAPQLVHKPDRPEALVRSRLPHGRALPQLSPQCPLQWGHHPLAVLSSPTCCSIR